MQGVNSHFLIKSIWFIEGESENQDTPLADCSACDPMSETQRNITDAIGGNHTREWRSLGKARGTFFHEINITINFPQVCLDTEMKGNLQKARNLTSRLVFRSKYRFQNGQLVC